MTMCTKWQHVASNCCIIISLILITLHYNASANRQKGRSTFGKLYIEPILATSSAGENATFKCFYPANVTFKWLFENDFPSTITNGSSTISRNGSTLYWSKITFLTNKESKFSSEISCLAEGHSDLAIAFLTVNGVKIGGVCHNSYNCETERAVCLNGICTCPQNNVVLWIGESGSEVCRERIYKLYDPCEFSEQCMHLLDRKSVCGLNGICTCAPWATDVNGKCVSKSEITYGRSQEMYRVGLIAVTCIIIVVVAVSLWITLRRSCKEQNSVRQRSSVDSDFNSGEPTFSPTSLYDVTSDKPPSYSDILETEEAVGASPPNFKDALEHSITAKKLLRQLSAPAGQLLSKTPNLNTPPYSKTGCDSPVFSNDGS